MNRADEAAIDPRYVAALEAQVTFDRKQVGKKSAGEHDDESGVGEMDPELFPGPTKTFHVRGNKINEQYRADQVTSGKNRNSKPGTLGRPPNQPALKIALLRFMNSEVNLRQRAGEDERHPRRQTNDCQF